jgi:hypothetical protein
MCCLQEGYDNNGTIVTRPLKDMIFTLGALYGRGMLVLNGAPNGECDAPRVSSLKR